MRKKRKYVERESGSNQKGKTIVVDDVSKRKKKRRGSVWRYFLSVLLGAMVVVSVLIFLTYQSLTVLFPWMFGSSAGNTVEKHYVEVSIPVWNKHEGKWINVHRKIADAGDEFTISYVFSQFTASLGFTFGYDTGQRLRIVSVENRGDWNVFLSGSGIPFYTSYRLRDLICSALDEMEKNIGAPVTLFYDGEDIKDYIPCNADDGYMVFYVRGNSVRARWVYKKINKADVASFFYTVLKKASMLGDTNLSDMVSSVSFENGTLVVNVKSGSFVNATTFAKDALIYNMMYLYPYINSIEINDPDSLPYTDVRLDPMLLIPTSGEDFIAQMGDRMTFIERLKRVFPIINSIKIGNGRAIVDFSRVPSREVAEAIARSVISYKGISSVILSVNGKIIPFFADPFEEDF